MHSVPVSAQTYSKLQSLAEPLVDTADSVIVRLIAAFESRSTPAPGKNRSGGEAHPGAQRMNGVRAGRGDVTHRDIYKELVVRILRQAGGEMRTRNVLDKVREQMKDRFVPLDLAKLPSGEERWRNAVRFARQALKEEGILDAAAPNGVWKLKR